MRQFNGKASDYILAPKMAIAFLIVGGFFLGFGFFLTFPFCLIPYGIAFLIYWFGFIQNKKVTVMSQEEAEKT